MRVHLLVLLGLALASPACEVAVPPRETPNIVLIIGDDHGYPDFGFMGSPYVETPHLDRLAAEGTVFTHGYNTASTCLPSLRTLLTGLHPHQFAARRGALWQNRLRLREPEWIREFVTLPRLLAERGYASFQAGKLWEADYRSAGFTEGMLKPGDDPAHAGPARWLGRDLPLDPVYDFVESNLDRPFFLWFAPMLPHTPHDASPEYLRRYEDRGLAFGAIRYYANITRFDALVGELVAFLEAKGLRRRTLVVYLADNGWDQPPRGGTFDLSGGPRGKQTLFELGLRTPILFCWPGVVPAAAVSDALVSTVDLFPTLLDYAGSPQPADRPGRSLRRSIEQREPWDRERVIGWAPAARVAAGPSAARLAGRAAGRSYFLTTGDWWYIWYWESDLEELYDLRRDPGAARDVAAEHPELVQRLRREIGAWDAATRRPFERLPAPRGEGGAGSGSSPAFRNRRGSAGRSRARGGAGGGPGRRGGGRRGEGPGFPRGGG